MDLENIKTITDVIFGGISVTVLGLVVVFSVLIIIMLFIYAMAFFSKEKKPEVTDTQETVIEEARETSETDESELIAVITAAVAACMGTSSASVNIKSYKKVSSAWSSAAKREILNRF